MSDEILHPEAAPEQPEENAHDAPVAEPASAAEVAGDRKSVV
jgi:hypothetical protein